MLIRKHLDRFFALPVDSGLEPRFVRHFRRNFIVNASDIILWRFGDSLMAIATILPVFASTLTDSPIVIGLIPALGDAGWFIPQLFTAAYVERLHRKLPAVRFLGLLERIPYMLLWLAALLLPGAPPWLAVAAFLGMMVWRGVASGVVALPWQELIATVIPPTHRGRFFGFANLMGDLLSVVGAGIAALILAGLVYPHNYTLAFFVGAIFIGASWGFLSLTVEPVDAPAPERRSPNGSLFDFKSYWSILREDANFRIYLVSRGLAYMGGMANGFLAVYGIEHFNLLDEQAAVFTALLFGSSILGNAVWGTLGDRLGHKRVLEFSTALGIATLLLALLSTSVLAYYVVFLLFGFGRAGGVLGDLNMALEIGPVARRPTYVGLARTAPGWVLFAAPLVGGALVRWAGYPVLFVVAIAFTVSGLALLWLRVIEPRHRKVSALS
jgi:MFS family permease